MAKVYKKLKINLDKFNHDTQKYGGGRVVRWCWVNFQCRGVLLIGLIVGQGPTALAVGAGGGCLDIFSLVYHFYFHSPSLWETARYRLEYCLKGPLNPKQPTNQPRKKLGSVLIIMYGHMSILMYLNHDDSLNILGISREFQNIILFDLIHNLKHH